MKDYVFTIKDDVCAANGKNPEATELLQKMKLWGTVEPYEKVIAGVKAEYQTVIDGLTKQLNAIKAQELTADEIVLLNAYRDCKFATGATYQARIDSLEKYLEEIRNDSQKRAAQIAELVSQLVDATAG